MNTSIHVDTYAYIYIHIYLYIGVYNFGEDYAYKRRIMLIYDGIHYDAIRCEHNMK